MGTDYTLQQLTRMLEKEQEDRRNLQKTVDSLREECQVLRESRDSFLGQAQQFQAKLALLSAPDYATLRGEGDALNEEIEGVTYLKEDIHQWRTAHGQLHE